MERKRSQLRKCLEEPVEYGTTWFEFVKFVHCPLPEFSLEKIDTTAEFLGKKFPYPLMASPLTGGIPESKEINRVIAEACSQLGIPMCLGSQRVALLVGGDVESFSIAREVSEDLFLVANIGMSDLVKDPSLAEKAVEMVDANALAIHVNPLQESLQEGGSPSFENALQVLEEVCEGLKVPVIVREVGCGMPWEIAYELSRRGVGAIDVGGFGGTNWAIVEAGEGSPFREWGIPTAASILEAEKARKMRQEKPEELPFYVVASGGIRSGLDVAKAVRLGADMAGVGLPILKAAKKLSLIHI